MDRYNNLNNTAPEVDPTKQKRPQIDKSDFDLGNATYFKALDGMIIPFWHMRVLPNSSIDLSFALRGLMTNPYVKELLSGKRAYVHVYHQNLCDIWEGADELLKKGRDFNTKLKIPTLYYQLSDTGNNATERYHTISAGAPSSYLGLPVGHYNTNNSPIANIKPQEIHDEGYKRLNKYEGIEVSALPLVMYQQIYQAHYLNKNLINTNTDWLPQVENHFILPLEASGQQVACLSYDLDTAKNYTVRDSGTGVSPIRDFNSDFYVPRNVDADHPQTKSNKPYLNVMRFRQFKGDMFTSGSPFPDLMRGDTPVMSFADLTGTIDWSNVVSDASAPTAGSAGVSVVSTTAKLASSSASFSGKIKDALDKAVVNVQNQLSFNLNVLRALDVYTLLGERAARTDGTYRNYIKTMFNIDPSRHSHDPKYLGGFYLDFVNSTIEQTSETAEGSPLGTVASRGITNGNGHIGKFSFNDHGYLMAVLDIVDETIYTGGVDRDWTDLEFEDQYVPLFNGLAPQATLNRELTLSGVKATDEGVFNYVERYSHLKSRRNKAVGQMALPAYQNNVPIDLESASYLHRREFGTSIEFNNLWVTMTPKNIDMTPYSSTTDYPFLMTAVASVNAVLPLPYITVPSGLSIMA